MLEKRLRVEVVYALPAEQVLVTLDVPPGTTVADAIELSGLARRFPGMEDAAGRAGVFGRRVAPDTKLADGDRVEIYRPLHLDPRERRRLRARR